VSDLIAMMRLVREVEHAQQGQQGQTQPRAQRGADVDMADDRAMASALLELQHEMHDPENVTKLSDARTAKKE
jgi:hypothetical protein